MRKIGPYFGVMLILFLFLMPPASRAAVRTVLIEQSMNAGCGCAGALNPSLDSLFAEYGHVDVVNIRYHGDSPWQFDPYFWANPAEATARYVYYSLSLMPTPIVDGQVLPKVCEIESIWELLDEDLASPSPMKLVAGDSLSGDSCFVQVSLIAEQAITTDTLMLRAAVIEDSIYYEAPNGQTVLNGVFRKFLPDPDGTAFEITQGETLDYEFTFEMDPAWDPANTSTIIFVQDDTDKSVLQAISSRPRPAAWARYVPDLRGKVESQGGHVDYPGLFINRGTARDTFDVHFSTDMPPDWTAAYEIEGGTPVVGGVTLDMDSTCMITPDIGCGYDPGTGTVTVTLKSRQDTSFARDLDFFAVSGVCALLIDDDGGHGFEGYYEDALDSAGIVWGGWNRRIARPTLGDLQWVDFTIWFTGRVYPTLDAYDQQLLVSYLSGDGRLFLTGQDIGYDLCDVNSRNRTDESAAFFENYLHATHVMSNSNLFTLTGRSGDPISDGMTLTIEGGDGADNQMFPDVIDSIAPARVIFDYSDPSKHGGIRFDSDSSKVVYLSFGFEAISNSGDRIELLSRVVDWLGVPSGIERPVEGLVVRCYPNPAVSYATVALSGVSRSSDGGTDGSVEVYDVTGRLIRRGLIAEPGMFVWDLTDSEGRRVAAGVYFLSISIGRQSVCRKVVLAR
jgi:hypothetical protein